MEKLIPFLVKASKACLFLSLLTFFAVNFFPPLASLAAVPFPLVIWKTFVYRGLISCAALFGLLALIAESLKTPVSVGKRITSFLRAPIARASIAFLGAALVSALLAPNAVRAFFGDVERGEGYLGLLYFFTAAFLSALFFSEKDWRRFSFALMGCGLLISLVAWLQFFGVSFLMFAASAQPGSFIGNPGFLSAFLSILIAAVFLLWRDGISPRMKKALTLVATVFIATLFITGIRGALIGLFAGGVSTALLFMRGGEKKKKQWASYLLVFLIAFGVVFFATKGSSLWDRVPTLNRLSHATAESSSVTTRLIGLKVSWNAFLEKPLFGWGPEHYVVAYNAHYDPAYSYYAEDWFDRAHNKIAEFAVTYGIAGLAAYLSLCWLILSKFRRNKLFVGAFIAYFVQNLFLFDNLASYIVFFAILGYALSHDLEEQKEEKEAAPAIAWGAIGVSSILIIALWYTGYHHIVTPVRQALAYSRAMATNAGARVLEASDSFLSPYTFLQPTLRGQFDEFFYNRNLIANPVFRPLIDKELKALEETAEREMIEPRQYIRLVEAYNELAKAEPALFEKSERFAREAVKLSPRRQGLLYTLAFTLAGQDKFDEAIRTNREALALDPRLYKSHYHLGLILGLASDAKGNKDTPQGIAYREEAEREFKTMLDLAAENDFQFFSEVDFNNMEIIYSRWKDYTNATKVIELGLKRFPSKKQWYMDGISFYREMKDADGIIRLAERLQVISPELKDSLDVIIDLARKRNWTILNSL